MIFRLSLVQFSYKKIVVNNYQSDKLMRRFSKFDNKGILIKMSDWKNKFTNLQKSYEVLCNHATLFQANKDNVEFYQIMRAGLIHVYEHTLELSWKTLKDYLSSQGFNDVKTPKQVIRTAFNAGIIKDGELWIEAIDDRNIVAHEYDEQKADVLCAEIIDKYLLLLKSLYLYLQQELHQ